MRNRFTTFLLCGVAAATASACSDDSPAAPPPSAQPAWSAVDTLGGSSTLALAVDPAGDWLLVVEGDGQGTGYRLYDLDTGDPLGPSRPLGGVSDVAVSLDGMVGAIVGAGLPETSLLSIDAGDEQRRVAVTGELVERHPSRDVFYVAGPSGLFRIDRQGAVSSAGPSVGAGEIRAIGLSSDGALLYAYERDGESSEILVLDASSMELVARIDSAIEVQAFVPLDGAERALAIGTPAERPFRGPVWAAEIDARAGRLGAVRTIADGIRTVAFSATSPWARVDLRTILVPSTYGIVSVNSASGEARMLPESAFEGLDPCCAIVSDPRRARLYATEHVPFREANGRVVVYEGPLPELLATAP